MEGLVMDVDRSGKIVLEYPVDGATATGYQGERYAVAAVVLVLWAIDGEVDVELRGVSAKVDGTADRRKKPWTLMVPAEEARRVAAGCGIGYSQRAVVAAAFPGLDV